MQFIRHEFRRQRTSKMDERHSGRPVEVKWSTREIKLHIRPCPGVFYFPRRKWCRKIMSATWLPRLLTMENKPNRVAGLALFRRSPDEFLLLYITVGETRINHYTREKNQQFEHWVSVPMKAKTEKPAKCLRFTRNYSNKLFIPRTKDKCRLLSVDIGPLEYRNKEITS